LGEHYASGIHVEQGAFLGAQQKIYISEQSVGDYTHTITYFCGGVEGTIAEKTKLKSLTWTPPLTFSSANTSGDYVYATLVITTHLGSSDIGTLYHEVLYYIPESVVPSFTVNLSDVNGFKDKHGEYIQWKSQLRIVVKATEAYDAMITSYKITANGETFTEEDITTNTLSSSGKIPIHVSVKDSRGRSSEQTIEVNVKAYNLPAVTSLSVKRCNSNGTANEQGAYVQVIFDATADPVNNTNTVAYKLEYKKTSATVFSAVNYPQYNNVFSLSGITYLFSADTGSSYNVQITITDAFGSIVKKEIAPTAATIMHWKANGRGIGLGKVSEKDDTVDVGWNMDMNSKQIKNLKAPTDENDAVPKMYADAIISKAYPVGAIYMSTSSTSPASLFGGTWEKISERFLFAANDSNSIYANGKQGGEAEHTLTTFEIPPHTHPFHGNLPGRNTTQNTYGDDFAVVGLIGPRYDLVLEAGGGQAHNNMPPFLAVYMWKRIA
jgi:hypothetical protein